MNKRTVLIFAFICFASLSALAQAKQDMLSEFIKAGKAAQELMIEQSFRTVRKTDDLVNGKVVKSVTSIYERPQLGGWRFLTTEKIGEKETRDEFIFLRSVRYRRKNKEPWSIEDYPKSSDSDGKSIGGSKIFSSNYTEELTVLDGKPARKFCEFKVLEKFDAAKPEGLSFSNAYVWFDSASGLLLKLERTEGLFEPRIEKTHSVTTYEYDPNIKIEAPIKDAPAAAKP